MAPNPKDTLRAKLLKTLDRKGFYYPRHVQVDSLVNMAPIASNDAGDAKDLVHDLARSDADPVRYVEGTKTVALEVDSQRWSAARISHYDADVLEWDQAQRLNGG